MKTIWHQGGWSRNFGDWVIFDSMHHHLSSCCDIPCSFVPVDGHKTSYRSELIDKLNLVKVKDNSTLRPKYPVSWLR